MKIRTLRELNSKKWNTEFKEKTIELYHKFDKEGLEFSSNLLGRNAQKIDSSVDEDTGIVNKPTNSLQEAGSKA